MRGLYSIIICSSVLIFGGCNYNVVKDPNALGGGQNGKQSAPISESALIDWNLMKSSVLSSCMSCHVGHSAPELGSLSSTQQNLNTVRTEIHANTMPPAKNGYAPLSDCRKAILDSWIQQGAPETTATRVGDLAACKGVADNPQEGPENTPIEQMPLTYQTLMTKILQPKCLKCHSPDSDDLEAAGLLFYPYSEITKRSRLWAGPGKTSKIVRSFTRTDGEQMPPPQDGAPLTPQEVEFVIRWIDAGRPE